MNQHAGMLGIPMTAEQYAEQWAADSKHLSDIGSYGWMTEQLGEPKLVIEIGCGAGRSTLALAKKSKVICIEPNGFLIESCHKYLKENGVDAEVVTHPEALKELEELRQVTIVNCDVFNSELGESISKFHPNAIVCWLIGAAPEQISATLDKPLNVFCGTEMPEYRKMIHKRCFDLGQEIFTESGNVHIVDRAGIPSWSTKDESRKFFAESYAELAGGSYSITPQATYLRKIPEGFGKSHIQMRQEQNFKMPIPVLTSLLAPFTR